MNNLKNNLRRHSYFEITLLEKGCGDGKKPSSKLHKIFLIHEESMLFIFIHHVSHDKCSSVRIGRSSVDKGPFETPVSHIGMPGFQSQHSL